MEVGFSIDPAQGLSREDELNCVRRAAELGFQSAWTPAQADASAFDRCLAWHEACRLPTGVAAVPASGQSPEFYAEQAIRVWQASGGNFVLGVGSGQLEHPASAMPDYLAKLRRLVPPGLPVYVAALGPRMLKVAAETGDGVLLNWCSTAQVAWSRAQVEQAASRAGRPTPPIVEYVRTAVDAKPAAAAAALAAAARSYALGPSAYRRHFARMGFSGEFADPVSAAEGSSPAFPSAFGAWGAPGLVRGQFLGLAAGLDCAIVRVLVREPGDVGSALLVLEECRPA
ncbi:MAG TPA: LLM class flavin-dependent oxidoreductase [Candidatus Dormibacteraeota bacterium]|nr:LLM class flavin-dependent oxidoreductase [Candidatus Dormibacteraeota bacterium]